MNINKFKIIIDEIYDETIGQNAFVFGQIHTLGNIYEMVYFFEIICKIQSDEIWLDLFFEKLQGCADKLSIIQELANIASKIFDYYSDSFNNSMQDILGEYIREAENDQEE